jgi:ketosteroid isomerase-like protein
MSQQTAEQSQQTAEQDEQRIRAVIDAWCEASSAGDLTAQFHLMTRDVVFLRTLTHNARHYHLLYFQ